MHLVSFRKHSIKLLVSQRTISLIYLPFPTPCLKLLRCHTHQMT